jgi:hypothetical protein
MNFKKFLFSGETMLGTPRLGIQTGPFLQDNPLLPRSTMDQLLDRFVELTQRDLSSWMDKALMHEKDVRSLLLFH